MKSAGLVGWVVQADSDSGHCIIFPPTGMTCKSRSPSEESFCAKYSAQADHSLAYSQLCIRVRSSDRSLCSLGARALNQDQVQSRSLVPVASRENEGNFHPSNFDKYTPNLVTLDYLLVSGRCGTLLLYRILF